ncbi:MAG TPA: 16S rRNA (guanine(527)-N(7))-methyltransferase RsmG [Burkholderiales bacterium]|jgi:16S rRNA (guanine527-N7)-methyltransferase|nr:16S rRNA (guanine(527)-N(7))-methyltransferase RsmG [Burkholderiales bacterium]
MTPQAALDQGLGELKLALPDSARGKLVAYLELLAKWNRTFNLTAIRDPLQMVSHHVLDSLAVLGELPAGRLADIGSGAGLPGIPIAIAEPERPVVLLEASEKKGSFLRQAVIELGLANSAVHIGRAEAWRPIEQFAVVISRAFAELVEFITCCRHLVAEGGVLAAMKAGHPHEELARAASDCDCSDVRRLAVPLLDAERHLVLCRLKS